MTTIVAILFFLVALLYASIGFGGGSGYLAAMSLAGVEPDIIKPTALTLNIMVASISVWKFMRAGHFSGRLFWPIAAMSIPFAFIGGRIALPTAVYKPLVGLILLYAAFRLYRTTRGASLPQVRPLPIWLALLAGGVIGLLSGLVGVGGGIFLSPLVLLAGWAGTRETMGISAAFILVNSVAGLLGHLSQVKSLPAGIPIWIFAAVVGGWIGAEYGSKRLSSKLLRQLLSLVLTIGGLKIMWG
ncbi:MAG: sulfite exporter TauE/SafE family protein [Chloroflexi bacterium]|nr:sulfite exporter TauE/SafE family protein [Chloroflexota bacterium]